jgi:hypothetical protein
MRRLTFQFTEIKGNSYRGSFGGVILERSLQDISISEVNKIARELYEIASGERTISGELKLATPVTNVVISEGPKVLFYGHYTNNEMFLMTARPNSDSGQA